ncbi:MAG: putative toxin-antitoxin system toxin component, PIN family [Acidobacteria bacterium]|nr:putative toxin-antitoxin system toxin component, PIN family [Acidobacteriota bacterium]
MRPSRLVLDTNVLVFALLKADSLPDRVLTLACSPPHILCVSAEILSEYETVMRRPRLKLDGNDVIELLRTIRSDAVVVSPSFRVSIASDPKDDIFLECSRGLLISPVVHLEFFSL